MDVPIHITPMWHCSVAWVNDGQQKGRLMSGLFS